MKYRTAAGVVFVVCLVLVWHNFSIVRVSGNSMLPNIGDGDLVLVSNDTSVGRGDIMLAGIGGRLVVKRVIGLPGETIEFRHGLLFVDGGHVEEGYVSGQTSDFSCTLGAGEVFLIGDNREESTDSRNYGPVSVEKLKGRVLTAG